MRTYRFTALAADDSAVSGTVRAAHLPAARMELFAQGLHRIALEEKRSQFSVQIRRQKVKRSDVLSLTRHLQGYLSASMQLLPALEGISAEHSSPAFRSVLSEVTELVAAGSTFGDALALHPRIFDDSYVAMVRAAEATNSLASVLEDLASHLEREQDSRERLKSESMTPLITLGVAVATVLVLVVFALPKFASYFDSIDGEMPFMAKVLFVAAGALQQWGALMAVGAVGAFALFTVFLRTELGRVWKDRTLLRLPVVGDLVRSNVVTRFRRVLGSMISAGVPAPEAVALAAAATNNRVYQRGLVPSEQAVLEGEGISVPLTRTNLFPANVCQVARSGEESSSLGPQLSQVSNMYAKESVHRLSRAAALFQPMMYAVVGAVVFVVVMGMVSAIYGSVGQMR